MKSATMLASKNRDAVRRTAIAAAAKSARTTVVSTIRRHPNAAATAIARGTNTVRQAGIACRCRAERVRKSAAILALKNRDAVRQTTIARATKSAQTAHARRRNAAATAIARRTSIARRPDRASKSPAAVHARKSAITNAWTKQDAVRRTASAPATKRASATSAKNNAVVKATNTAKAANATCKRASATMTMTAKTLINVQVTRVYPHVRRTRVQELHRIVLHI